MKWLPATQLLSALAGVVAAGAPEIFSEDEIPNWATESTMQLSLSSAAGDVSALDYPIMPSTKSLGLNQSDVVLGTIKIKGIMIAANADSYDHITGQGQIAYLSCDDAVEDEDAIDSNIMLMELMENKPKAIILYSTVGNWCRLTGSDLPYESIFSMADAGDSTQALEILNGTNEFDAVQVTITGNATSEGPGNDDDDGGGSSAVAMSILYTITGLVTLLFLIIIFTGAVRAHRYPERYGPRAGHGGQPRQSRAKGLARAVLETIPIVKFGNPDPPKPDPNLELENASIGPNDRPVELTSATNASAQQGQQHEPEEGQRDAPAGTGPEAESQTNDNAGKAAGTGIANNGEGQPTKPDGEESLGCSICTEDFTVGEDVRVLPCNHKFHPNCVDPWLVNVSGTCPLCRLDLRPKKDKDGGGGNGEAGSSDDPAALPPPLVMEHDPDADGSTAAAQSQRGPSRFFDINRLRHASAEERIQALRQYRTEQQSVDDEAGASLGVEAEGPNALADENPGPAEGTGAAAAAVGGRRARLADRLKEKFRIRTGPQALSSEDSRLRVQPVNPQL